MYKIIENLKLIKNHFLDILTATTIIKIINRTLIIPITQINVLSPRSNEKPSPLEESAASISTTTSFVSILSPDLTSTMNDCSPAESSFASNVNITSLDCPASTVNILLEIESNVAQESYPLASKTKLPVPPVDPVPACASQPITLIWKVVDSSEDCL